MSSASGETHRCQAYVVGALPVAAEVPRDRMPLRDRVLAAGHAATESSPWARRLGWDAPADEVALGAHAVERVRERRGEAPVLLRGPAGEHAADVSTEPRRELQRGGGLAGHLAEVGVGVGDAARDALEPHCAAAVRRACAPAPTRQRAARRRPAARRARRSGPRRARRPRDGCCRRRPRERAAVARKPRGRLDPRARRPAGLTAAPSAAAARRTSSTGRSTPR